jgi:Leucine-rich repeat (LRR) protein
VPSTSDEEDTTCKFPSLRVLDLASNNFSGTLTKAWLTELKSMIVKSENEPVVKEYLGTNKITTLITYKGFDFTISNTLWTLVYINISSNALRGSIPESIGGLAMLNVLNMSRNSLAGPIPSQLGRLGQMETLDLSFNELSGTVPQELASLDFLPVLNLSCNKLEGRVPESPHFMTFSDGSFLGNGGLCGPPLSKECIGTIPPPAVSGRSMERSVDIVLFPFVGLGFGVGFAVAVAVMP